MKSDDVIKQLKDNGWVLQRIKGSHHTFEKEGVKDIITISHPRKDMPIGQLKDIEKKSGLKFK
jgi:hypothetical protein